jgi:hypothetical protein
MTEETYRFIVEDADERSTGEGARRLADLLREAPGVNEVTRTKADESTMDLGAIVSVIATAGATSALARGVADWLRGTRGTRVKIEMKAKSGSIKAEVDRIDPATALRIVELLREG